MSEHLRHLARHADTGLACMPNAGLPELTADGAHYPLTPRQLADAHDLFTAEYGLALVGGCCGTTPEHLRQVVERVARARRSPLASPASSRASQPLPARPVPPGHVVPRHRRADERQRLEGVPRGDARAALGRLRRDRARRRPATGRTCSTCASTTSAGTAWRTCATSRAGSRRPARCRSCSTRPSPRSSRPGWSAWADEASSTR